MGSVEEETVRGVVAKLLALKVVGTSANVTVGRRIWCWWSGVVGVDDVVPFCLLPFCYQTENKMWLLRDRPTFKYWTVEVCHRLTTGFSPVSYLFGQRLSRIGSTTQYASTFTTLKKYTKWIVKLQKIYIKTPRADNGAVSVKKRKFFVFSIHYEKRFVYVTLENFSHSIDRSELKSGFDGPNRRLKKGTQNSRTSNGFGASIYRRPTHILERNWKWKIFRLNAVDVQLDINLAFRLATIL